MPSDFGDESGEKMVDWMLRVGQDAGGEAMQASAERLATAFRNARLGVSGQARAADEGEQRSWARLNLREFEELPEYESIKQIIDERLSSEGIKHEFAMMGDHENLVFLVEDAPDVSRVFQELEEKAGECAERAQERLREVRTQAKDEPLAEKAAAAREASKQIESAKGKTREVTRAEMRAK